MIFFRNCLQENLFHKNQHEFLCNNFTKYLDETKIEQFLKIWTKTGVFCENIIKTRTHWALPSTVMPTNLKILDLFCTFKWELFCLPAQLTAQKACMDRNCKECNMKKDKYIYKKDRTVWRNCYKRKEWQKKVINFQRLVELLPRYINGSKIDNFNRRALIVRPFLRENLSYGETSSTSKS